VHSHLPSWVYKALAAVGGVGVLHQWVSKLVVYLMNIFWNSRDVPVWAVLRVPKFKPSHTHNNWTFYSTDEIPYSPEEIATKVHRSIRSVTSSLHRLEKRGKVKELQGGWQRKES